MDLNDWLRGQRDWLELVEFMGRIERYGRGSHYRAAKLRDPQLVEHMALRGDQSTAPKPTLEEFDSLRAEFAEIKDILWIIAYTAGRSDPKHAPKAARPEMPWEPRRAELMSDKSRWIRSQMVPWEVD